MLHFFVIFVCNHPRGPHVKYLLNIIIIVVVFAESAFLLMNMTRVCAAWLSLQKDSDPAIDSRRSMSAGRHTSVATTFTGSLDSSRASQGSVATSGVVQPGRKSCRERLIAFREHHSLSETSVFKRDRQRFEFSRMKYLLTKNSLFSLLSRYPPSPPA